MSGKRRWSAVQKWGVAGAALLFLVAVIYGFINGKMKELEPRMETAPETSFAETIVVVADGDYQPYSFYDENGEPAGYDVELIYLLANRMQKNVDIRLMQWVDAKAAVQSGEADVLMGQDYNVEALEEYELSMPLDNDPFVAFGPSKLSAIDEFYEKRIATLEGSGSFPVFLTPYQLEGNTHVYSSYSAAFESVENGENDYAIAMYSVGRRAIANIPQSKLRAVGPVLAGNYLCIGTQKGNTALIEELNAAIIALKREGDIDRLGEKWLGRYVEVISPRDFLEKNFTAIILLAAFLLLSAALTVVAVNRRQAKNAAMQHEMTKRVLEYQQLLTEATKGLYENIYEFDITHRRAGGESTRKFFESLGISPDASYEEALLVFSQKRIKAEYIPGYLDLFAPEHVLETYRKGKDSLSYEFLTTNGDCDYYWMRITARIFYWMEDAAVHMITYRQNIDGEKKKEQDLEEKVREDALTGLYNKVTTGELIRDVLSKAPDVPYAFLMLDIDDFKNVNDSLGHAFGDYVIVEFARRLKNSAAGDIVGRIGGDEFALFMPYESRERLEAQAADIISGMCSEIRVGETSYGISSSMGIALCPQDGRGFDELYRKADTALYQTKRGGKNGYTFYGGTKA